MKIDYDENHSAGCTRPTWLFFIFKYFKECMKTITLVVMVFLVIHCPIILATDRAFQVAIIPDLAWALKETQNSTCKIPAVIPFRMSSIGSKVDFLAVASFCGSIDSMHLHELFKKVQLAKVSLGFKGAWKVSVKGTDNAVLIDLLPAGSCPVDTSSEKWILVRIENHWKVLSKLPGLSLVPCIIEY
jgi:hypothetical protein